MTHYIICYKTEKQYGISLANLLYNIKVCYVGKLAHLKQEKHCDI